MDVVARCCSCTADASRCYDDGIQYLACHNNYYCGATAEAIIVCGYILFIHFCSTRTTRQCETKRQREKERESLAYYFLSAYPDP